MAKLTYQEYKESPLAFARRAMGDLEEAQTHVLMAIGEMSTQSRRSVTGVHSLKNASRVLSYAQKNIHQALIMVVNGTTKAAFARAAQANLRATQAQIAASSGKSLSSILQPSPKGKGKRSLSRIKK